MKQFIKMMAMGLAAMMMVMGISSCTPKEKVAPEVKPDALAATSWEAVIESNYQTMHIHADFMLDFFDEAHGEFFLYMHATVPSMPGYSDDFNEGYEFDYLFDGHHITLIDTDEEAADEDNVEMTYDATSNTIALIVDDEEVSEILGIHEVKFQQVEHE